MKYPSLMILGILACFSLRAQMHDFTTLLGYNTGSFGTPGANFNRSRLTFPDGSLQLDTVSGIGMYFDVTNAILSDSGGVLQVFSNGTDIGSLGAGILENGNILVNDWPAPNKWPQLALALPKPGNGKRVLLFYGDEEAYWPFGTDNEVWIVSKNLYAAEIDMTLNNGAGKVISRGQLVVEDTLSIGKFTACKHANGRDWWVLAHEQNSNRYHRILVDPAGVREVGVQVIGMPYPDGVGQACFSPNGEKYVVMDGVDFDTATTVGCLINIYDFDRCTGLLSDHRQINQPSGAWAGGAISFDSRYYYAGFQFFCRQYDLDADDIEASGTVVMEYDGYLAPFPTRSWFHQLMPDGKIYVCTSTRSNVLHVIHHPDKPRAACDYEQHAVHLPTKNAFAIPNFPFFRLGPVDGSSCDTLGLNNRPKAWYRYDQDTLDALSVEFHDLSYYEPTSWSWEFDDPASGAWNTSAERHPEHLFSAPGQYEVCLTVSNANGSDKHCKTLYLGVSAQDNPVVQSRVMVTPNPFRDRLSVSLSTTLKQPVFRLYDMSGRLLRSAPLRFGINELETADLGDGFYFWEVVSDRERVKVGKIVKAAE